MRYLEDPMWDVWHSMWDVKHPMRDLGQDRLTWDVQDPMGDRHFLQCRTVLSADYEGVSVFDKRNQYYMKKVSKLYENL